ncbi:MAG: T9SS type A sorting domain-containing protein [Bacteroidetes bacterium]|nr:T9SS type A sorting domain-containing protein [Bacteroidota bacterium]
MKNNTLLLLIALLFGTMSMAQTFTSIDINTGAGNSSPTYLTSYQGKVYFRAYTPATGVELYVSDGTISGTQILNDILPGPGNSNPVRFLVCNNRLFFTANDSIHGSELWVTDGTSAGTHMVVDAAPGTPSSNPNYMTSFNNKVYYSASEATHGSEIWVSDGTTSGTSLLKDINPGSASSIPEGYTSSAQQGLSYQFNEFNGALYFRADDGTHGNELWKTDGTSAGTTMVADILPGPNGSRPYMMQPYNGQMLLGANDSIHGFELWISDGTAAGTSLLKDIDPGIAESDPASYSGFVALNNKLYFMAQQTTTGNELWVTDGTTAGTSIVKDILPGPGSSAAGQYGIIAWGGNLYFAAFDSINGAQLWASDGTGSGTSLLKILGTGGSGNSNPRAFISYNSQLLFVAGQNTSMADEELWTSDGTATNTHVIAPAVAPNLNPLSTNVYGYSMCWNNGSLFMAANFNSIGDELWIYTTPSTAITEAGAASGISAYPNPFADAISLTGLADVGAYAATITDLEGREIDNFHLEVSDGKASIRTHDLSAGAYLVHISGSSIRQTFKMIKQ